MKQLTHNFSRYLPADTEALNWGWHILDAGRQTVPIGTEYPPADHPSSYLFGPDERRILDEYQIVFIVSGQGRFRSKSMAKCKIQSGTALLLFPGEWHHYQPDPETGWQEYWVGFHGSEAVRILQSFFNPQHAVIHCNDAPATAHIFQQLLYWLEQTQFGRDQITASHIPMLLALLRSSATQDTAHAPSDAVLALQAKAEMLQQLHARTDLKELARKLGTSYSRFRFAFKKETGHSPREFENQIKLSRARDLLHFHHKNVSETAHLLGYSSVYYFSRAFKQRYGLPPKLWAESKRLTPRTPSHKNLPKNP